MTNPYEPSQAEPEPRPLESNDATGGDIAVPFQDALAAKKRRMLFGMVVLFAVNGFLTGVLGEDSALSAPLELVTAIAFAVMVVCWCEYDRIQRQAQRWRFFIVLMVVCPGPLVMIPVYLCVTRGVRGLISTAMAAAFFLLLIAVAMTGLLAGALLNNDAPF